MNYSRRNFLSVASAAVSTLGIHSTLAALPQRSSTCIATWPFGLEACRTARANLGTSLPLECLVEGISVTESDLSNQSVGAGGLPNADGVLQLDACIMNGQTRQAGAVAGLSGFAHPIDVAHQVMTKTRHVMLVGEDAATFASEQGCEALASPLTSKSREAWEKWKQNRTENSVKNNHDTIALLMQTSDGSMFGGCSTSGLAFKLPGRVGDSPIIGSGLYVDGDVGGAGATGIGENIMRYCGSFLAVEFMRQGLHPTEACRKVIERIAEGEQKPPAQLSVNFIAMNREGECGAAGTDASFKYAIDSDEHSAVENALLVE